MSLYICEVTVTVIVDADNESEAAETAISSARNEIANSPSCLARKITDAGAVPTAWLDAIPYSDHDMSDATVAERLAAAGVVDRSAEAG